MPKFSTHVALMNPAYQPVSFAPGDEVPEWAIDLVGDHVLAPEDRTESDDSDESDTSDESGSQGQDDSTGDEDPGDDEDAEGDGEESNPPAADDQPDFTAPAPARRNSRSRK